MFKNKSAFEQSLKKTMKNGRFHAPKDKHLRTVIWTFQGRDPATHPELALSKLTERLLSSRWEVVLAGLYLLHCAMKPVGTLYCARVPAVTVLVNEFCDASEKGASHNKVVQLYSEYTRVAAGNLAEEHGLLRVQQELALRNVESIGTKEVFREALKLLTQLKCVTGLIEPLQKAIKNYTLGLTKAVTYQVLCDSVPLYKLLGKLFDRLVAQFDSFDLQSALEVYKACLEFGISGKELYALYQLGHKLPYTQIVAPRILEMKQKSLDRMKSRLTQLSNMRPSEEQKDQGRPLTSNFDFTPPTLNTQVQAVYYPLYIPMYATQPVPSFNKPL